jgi:hypothetical protein
LLALVPGGARPALAVFDEIEISPRVRALGGSGAALTADAYAPFHNPALLAWTGRVAGAASYLRPFGYDFSSQSALVGTMALRDRLGGAGIGIRRFGVDYQGEALLHETTMTFAHGLPLISDRQSELAVGWAVSVYALDFGRSVTGIDPGRATSAGIHLGAAAVVRDRTRVGFYALNINNPTIGDRDKDDLPRQVAVGISYAPYPGVETVLDVVSQLGEDVQYRGGAEFEVAEFLRLRTGLSTDPNALTAGLGLRRAGVAFDYAFSTGGGVLGDTHHFGIGIALPGTK